MSISPHGLWLWLQGSEYLLALKDHPWFQDARLPELFNVILVHEKHLRWPDLDVDLHVDSLTHPERFPLQSRVLTKRHHVEHAKAPRTRRGG